MYTIILALVVNAASASAALNINTSADALCFHGYSRDYLTTWDCEQLARALGKDLPSLNVLDFMTVEASTKAGVMADKLRTSLIEHDLPGGLSSDEIQLYRLAPHHPLFDSTDVLALSAETYGTAFAECRVFTVLDLLKLSILEPNRLTKVRNFGHGQRRRTLAALHEHLGRGVISDEKAFVRDELRRLNKSTLNQCGAGLAVVPALGL